MIRTMQEFVRIFKVARCVSTHLVAVRTADPASTIQTIQVTLNSKTKNTAILYWDVMCGLLGLNAVGKQAATTVLNGGEADVVSTRPSDALGFAGKVGEDAIVFFTNGPEFFSDPTVVQAVWNLRDSFKVNRPMLVILMTSGATLPSILSEDVLLLDEPLPSADDLARIVSETYAAAEISAPEPEQVQKVIEALRVSCVSRRTSLGYVAA
jgi:hypothetical protein